MAQPTRRDRAHAVTAGFLGWTMDAFDFFVVVFLVDTLAERFGVTKKDIIWTITATLAMRPVGAVIFGLLADRYGRRIPLMANLVFFSIVEVLCGFAPNYATFLVLRALFGIGMGGEWGVGASLAMESAPRRWRGMLSGILQSGYSIGYLLAAVAARLVLPAWGWRAMFWVGGLPALLAFYIRWHVPESEAWKQHRAPTVAAILTTVRRFVPRLVYLVALMTMMMFLSHGTQDLYPDFLKIAHGIPAQDRGARRDPLQRRRGHGRDRLRPRLRAHRPPLQHDRRPRPLARRHPVLGLRRLARGARDGGVLHADGRPGSLGHHPRSPERALAGLDPRPRPGPRVPARHPLRRRR